MPPTSAGPPSPPPAGRLAASYAERMRPFARFGRIRDAATRLGGSTAADTADSLRWARPDRPSARPISQP